MKLSSKKSNAIVYAVIVAVSVLFLYIGNKVATTGIQVFFDSESSQTAEAEVLEIISAEEEDSEWVSTMQIVFEARITGGERKGEIVTAEQSIGGYFGSTREVSKGDKILMYSYEAGEWYFMDYVRLDKILVLAAVFLALLLLFGRFKGVNAVLSLCLTCAAIFAVFLPALLSGKNIYIAAVTVCVYSIVTTLFIVNGINKKSMAAVAGCFGGVFLIGLLSLVMDNVLHLTGMLSEESQYLLYLPVDPPIDLRAVIFAGIMIGAVGAVMDVAVSIASSLWEVRSQAPQLTRKGLFTSGIHIGRDIMGTMTNTLVLAYIGSSLSIVLLLFAYTNSITELLNRELVIVELLQAIVGSLGILLTIPLTALICSALYSNKTQTLQGG